MLEIDLGAFVAGARVDLAVFALRPDYRALLVAVEGMDTSAAGDEASDAYLAEAESAARIALGDRARGGASLTWPRGGRPTGRSARSRSAPATAWRRSCAEPGPGCPRVNRLTDLYNAVSVLHQIPLGGEDLSRYIGSPRLIRATGTEPFDTVADGTESSSIPIPERWCGATTPG